MSSDPVFDKFIQRQHEEGMNVANSSDLFTLVPLFGRRFVGEFRCKGLAREQGRVVEQDFWAIGVRFPEDYLRRPVDVAEVLTYLGPAREPWHPNIRPPFICMHLAPGAPLVEIIYGLFDLLTWQLVSTSDEGLNHEAAQWCRHQDPSRFPIDKRPLKRRRVALQVEPLEQAPAP